MDCEHRSLYCLMTWLVASVLILAAVGQGSAAQQDDLVLIPRTNDVVLMTLERWGAQKAPSVPSLRQILEKEVMPAYSGPGAKYHNDSICSCQNYTCGCCLRLEVEKISLNDTACVNISYLPDEYGFQFEFILNNRVIIKKKISVKNPPPICAAIPYVHQLASLCIRFYDLDYKSKQFSGCAEIEAELEGVVVKKYELGCFHIPPNSTSSMSDQVSEPMKRLEVSRMFQRKQNLIPLAKDKFVHTLP